MYIYHGQWKEADTHMNQKVVIQTGFQIVNYVKIVQRPQGGT